MITWVKFFVFVMAGSIGFQRVAVLAIGLVRKAAVDDRHFLILLDTFFHIFSPDGAMRQLHCHFGFQARLSDFGFKRTGCLNFFPLLTWAILSGSVVEKFRPS